MQKKNNIIISSSFLLLLFFFFLLQVTRDSKTCNASRPVHTARTNPRRGATNNLARRCVRAFAFCLRGGSSYALPWCPWGLEGGLKRRAP